MPGRQLDRQRQAIDLLADGRHVAHWIGSRWPYGLGSFTEERHRVCEHEWSKPEFLLGAQAQGYAAGHQHRQTGTASQQGSDERGTVQDLLGIVEHKQEVLLVQACLHLLGGRGGSCFADPERLGDYPWNEGGIADGSQCDEDHAIDKVSSEVLGDLECQPRLADTTWSYQGEQVDIGAPQQGQGMGAFLPSTNESRRRKGVTR